MLTRIAQIMNRIFPIIICSDLAFYIQIGFISFKIRVIRVGIFYLYSLKNSK
jgi:hypothetical protein